MIDMNDDYDDNELRMIHFFENIILRVGLSLPTKSGDTFKKKKRSEKNVLIPQ